MTEIDSNTFHPLEKTVLKNLVKKKSINLDELSTASGLNIDQIRRSVEWLKEKKLLSRPKIGPQFLIAPLNGWEPIGFLTH